MNKTIIDLLRHGEVQGETCFRGSQDDPLTPQGLRQMQRQTAGLRWDTIISSPLQRCQAFAEKLKNQENTALNISPAFREIHFGDWEGKSAEQISQNHARQLQLFYQDPVNHPPPSGEPFKDFEHRVMLGWHTLLKERQNQYVLVITHAGVIRLLFSQIFNLPYSQCFQFEIAPAHLTRLTVFHHADAEDFIQLNFHQAAT